MEATKLKEEGVLAGVPDVFVAEPMGRFAGLWVEMKRQSGGRVSKEQEAVQRLLKQRNYEVAVCLGCEDAWEKFEAYMRMYNPEQ